MKELVLQNKMKRLLSLAVLTLFAFSCEQKEETLFELLPSTETGVDFVNKMEESKEINLLNFAPIYNGAGV